MSETTTTFDPNNEATWPSTLFTPEVGAIMRRAPRGVIQAIYRGTFLPVPIAERPYRWRREDLIAWRRGDYRDAEAALRKRARKRRVA